ncbi:NAD(P)-dependent alcohol dehydrogenase [uncultured Bacteroides sp.]|uniref:NAD(P)-dependent alcohol dehydrogenase n=1 Tax=uncultured Bacteroides sp. TaxID=162156 RepID=UPI002AA73172|nr:NAD(P)-dependent alcohol dehydrogenase [uncultured Bacteroides sp.]
MNRISKIVLFLLCVASVEFTQAQRIQSEGLAAIDNKGNFEIYKFTRHPIGDNDIFIDILYAGICHSDIHHVHEDWGKTEYPIVPGHEIVGVVKKVGKNVTKFKVGDYAGVGCIVNSCGQCDYCKQGLEQFCEKGMVVSFGSHDYFHNNELTMGGFSKNYVVSEDYAIKVPANANIKKVAPLLCAGITTYSPIHFSKVSKGQNVAVAGFGGLGHLALKYMVALGAKVTVFDITEEKRQDAYNMGAIKYVNVKTPDELKKSQDQFDFILSTIPAAYDPMMYVKMLKMGGEMAIVGLPPTDATPNIPTTSLIYSAHRKVYGSLIGGIPETQEMLDYSVANNIYPQVELIPATPEAVEKAFKNVVDGKVKFRYVIDMSTLK